MGNEIRAGHWGKRPTGVQAQGWPCRVGPLLATLVLAALLAGCGESGSPVTTTSAAATANCPAAALDASWGCIQDQVFTPKCIVCHSGPAAPNGMRLDAANSRGDTLGVPSVEVPALLRIQVASSTLSYLVQKLEGTAAVGGRMPLGGPYLSATEIGVIKKWIDAGAK